MALIVKAEKIERFIFKINNDLKSMSCASQQTVSKCKEDRVYKVFKQQVLIHKLRLPPV